MSGASSESVAVGVGLSSSSWSLTPSTPSSEISGAPSSGAPSSAPWSALAPSSSLGCDEDADVEEAAGAGGGYSISSGSVS